MDSDARAIMLLASALIIGAILEQVVQDEATAIGLSDTELMLLGAGAGALVRRAARRWGRPGAIDGGFRS